MMKVKSIYFIGPMFGSLVAPASHKQQLAAEHPSTLAAIPPTGLSMTSFLPEVLLPSIRHPS